MCVGFRVSVEQLSPCQPPGEEVVVVVWSFSFRKVPEEVAQQQGLVREYVSFDRNQTTEPATVGTV